MKNIFLVLITGLFLCAPAAAQEMPGLAVGATAPDFEAGTYAGGRVKLSEELKNGPVVLIFYRGGWCPYCIRHLQDIQSRLEEFEARGASVIAVSVDLAGNELATVKENKLGFTVVSDSAADILEDYGLMFHVPDETVEKYVEYGIDLKASSGRDDHVIAVPAAYVIKPDGRIAYAYANLDYKVRAKPDDLLKALDEMSR